MWRGQGHELRKASVPRLRAVLRGPPYRPLPEDSSPPKGVEGLGFPPVRGWGQSSSLSRDLSVWGDVSPLPAPKGFEANRMSHCTRTGRGTRVHTCTFRLSPLPGANLSGPNPPPQPARPVPAPSCLLCTDLWLSGRSPQPPWSPKPPRLPRFLMGFAALPEVVTAGATASPSTLSCMSLAPCPAGPRVSLWGRQALGAECPGAWDGRRDTLPGCPCVPCPLVHWTPGQALSRQ